MCLVNLFLALLQLAILSTTNAQNAVPKYAPIPAGAGGPPIPADPGYRVQDFGQGAYMITDGVYQSIFFVCHEGVTVVDAPPTIGANIVKAVSSVTSLPITHVVYSHSHADHIGAAAMLGSPANITFIAHEETARQLSLTPDIEHRPMPTITFDSSYTLYFCRTPIQLTYNGPNHCPGNIFIYAPVQKILMVVDLVFPGWIPFEDLAEAQTIPGFIKAHDQILGYDFDYYVGGHLNRVGTREDVLIQREWLQDVYDSCVEGFQLALAPPNATNPLSEASLLPPIAKANPNNPWATYGSLYIAVAEYSTNFTTAKWLGKLAGADVFGYDNALAMVKALVTDYGILEK